MSFSGFPVDEIEVPHAIRLISGNESVVPVWLNGEGGVTFQIGAGPDRRFAKWGPAGSALDLAAEAARLRWAADFGRVPRVLDFKETATGAYLVTVGLPGQSAIADRWKARPEMAVRVAGSCSSPPTASVPTKYGLASTEISGTWPTRSSRRRRVASRSPAGRAVSGLGD